MRTYTVRRHLPGERRIEVDFVLHGAERDRGPASRWATVAAPGDTVGMYGPAATHHRTPAPRKPRRLGRLPRRAAVHGSRVEKTASKDTAHDPIRCEPAIASPRRRASSRRPGCCRFVHRVGRTAAPPGR